MFLGLSLSLCEECAESGLLSRAEQEQTEEPDAASLLTGLVFVVCVWAESTIAKLSSSHAPSAICVTLSLLSPLLFFSCFFFFA